MIIKLIGLTLLVLMVISLLERNWGISWKFIVVDKIIIVVSVSLGLGLNFVLSKVFIGEQFIGFLLTILILVTCVLICALRQLINVRLFGYWSPWREIRGRKTSIWRR